MLLWTALAGHPLSMSASHLISSQTSMARATAEDSTTGLRQLLRTEPPLVGGLSFHGVSRLCISSLHMGCQEEVRRGRLVTRTRVRKAAKTPAKSTSSQHTHDAPRCMRACSARGTRRIIGRTSTRQNWAQPRCRMNCDAVLEDGGHAVRCRTIKRRPKDIKVGRKNIQGIVATPRRPNFGEPGKK